MPTLTLQPLQCLTVAPEDYDWGWQRTIAYNVATDSRGRPMRLCENADPYHFHHQVGRYGSGLMLTITNQADLDKHLAYGFIKLTEDPIPVSYLKIDTSSVRQTLGGIPDTLLPCIRKLKKLAEGDPNVRAEGSSMDTFHLRAVGTDARDKVLAIAREHGIEVQPDT